MDPAASGTIACDAALVVAEVALALVLLIGAGLLLRSFAALQRVETGFDAANLLVIDLPLSPVTYREDLARTHDGGAHDRSHACASGCAGRGRDDRSADERAVARRFTSTLPGSRRRAPKTTSSPGIAPSAPAISRRSAYRFATGAR